MSRFLSLLLCYFTKRSFTSLFIVFLRESIHRLTVIVCFFIWLYAFGLPTRGHHLPLYKICPAAKHITFQNQDRWALKFIRTLVGTITRFSTHVCFHVISIIERRSIKILYQQVMHVLITYNFFIKTTHSGSNIGSNITYI